MPQVGDEFQFSGELRYVFSIAVQLTGQFNGLFKTMSDVLGFSLSDLLFAKVNSYATSVLQSLMTSLFLSRLDYSNAPLAGIPS